MDSLAHALGEIIQTTAFVCDDCEDTAVCQCVHPHCVGLANGRAMLMCSECARKHGIRKWCAHHSLSAIGA